MVITEVKLHYPFLIRPYLTICICNLYAIHYLEKWHSHFCERLNFLSPFVGEMEPEQVLNLEQVSQQKTGHENDKRKQRCQWTVQRIRLSPQEKHLAATVKNNHREEPR